MGKHKRSRSRSSSDHKPKEGALLQEKNTKEKESIQRTPGMRLQRNITKSKY